jgi:hypothetical protein
LMVFVEVQKHLILMKSIYLLFLLLLVLLVII